MKQNTKMIMKERIYGSYQKSVANGQQKNIDKIKIIKKIEIDQGVENIQIMKQVPYSPFNRSYKYICLQNQLAHSKNKKSVKGLVDSNLNLSHNFYDSFGNTNGFGNSKFFNSSVHSKGQEKQKSITQTANGTMKSSWLGLTESRIAKLKEQPLVIHMNSRYNSRQNYDRVRENERMNRKLSQTKCRVIPYKETQKNYKNAKQYKQIAMRYNEGYQNKQLICFAQTSLTSTFAKSDPSTARYLCRGSSARVRNQRK